MTRLPSFFAITALLGATAASALDLPDPTRPPMARLTAPQGAADAASGAAPRGPVGPLRGRLSAVMLADAPGRNAAVIDGRVRYVGDNVPGSGVVTRIEANGVTLRQASGRTERLNVYDRAADPDPAKAAQAPAPHEAVSAATAAASLPESSSMGASPSGKEQP